MKHGLTILAMACAIGCTKVPPEKKAFDDAAAALGGKDRIQAAATIVIEGEGSAPNAGQNMTPDGPLPVWKVTGYKRAIDLANGRTRMQQTRTAQFQYANSPVQRQDQSLDGDVAFGIGPNGKANRAAAAAARDWRIEMLHHPVTIVRAALDPAATITNLRQQASERLVDVTTARGDMFTLAIDDSTKLPTRVISMIDNANMGDVALATSFSSYEDVNGLKLPRHLITNLDKYLQFDLQVSKNTVDGATGDLAAPAAVKAAAPPPPSAIVVTAEPIGKGIWWLAGSGNHRSVVFEFADHLVLFEAPLNEARSKAVIDKARSLSTKPLTHVIISHHHFDHSGGLRVAVESGRADDRHPIAATRPSSTISSPAGIRFCALKARSSEKPEAREVRVRGRRADVKGCGDGSAPVPSARQSTRREPNHALPMSHAIAFSSRPTSTTPRGSNICGARTRYGISSAGN